MPTILLSKIYPKGSALKNLRVGSTDVKYVKRGDGKLFYDTLKSTTYNKPSITLTYPTSNTSAAGGTTSPSSFSYSQSWYYTGHSGNTYSQSNKTSGATVRYSISGTGASINESTGVVTWASRGTTYSTSTREATVTVTVAMNGQTNTATAVVKQAKNDMTIIGGDTTYGNVIAGSITNATIPASGGTKTATAGNGSLSYSTTRKYYLYDSGSEETVSNATSGTISVDPSPASLSATASSRGTTYVSSSTIVDYVTVEWSANGKSATDTMYVYLAENIITSGEFTSKSGGALTNPATYAAAGETKSVANKTSASTGVTLTFSSGDTTTSYSTYGTLSTTYSWSSNLSYATLTSANASSLNVTMAANSTTSLRTATITRTASFKYLLSSSYTSMSAITSTATATAIVTLAAKSVITYKLTKVLSSGYPALISKDGGSIYLYLFVEYTKTENGTTTTHLITYNTSGTNGTLSGLTISGTGASVNSVGTVTWAANSGALRSATVKGTFTYMGSSIAFEAKSDLAAGTTNVTKYARIEFRNTTGAGTFTVEYNAGGVIGSYQMIFAGTTNVNKTTISVSVPSTQNTVIIAQITRSDSSICKYYMNSSISSSGQSLQWTLNLSTSSDPTTLILYLLPYPSC